jgi:peptide/nickel transport system substrate-binding protein
MLAEALPELGTASWRVESDGRMTTTYRLKPNLTWQDGTALAAEDFVFAWQVYRTPDFGLATSNPQGIMDKVEATDPRTFVVSWTKPYPDAGVLNLPPMPRHILQAPYQAADFNAFAAHPYWTREYVGLGPFKLSQWEPGAFIDAEAFPGFVLGRPKIDRVQIRFMGDANAALATLLARDVDVLADVVVSSQQLPPLKSQFVAPGAGSYVFQPGIFRQAAFQLRPEMLSNKALLDVRVRKALAHTLDKQSINDAIYSGEGLMTGNLLPTGHAYFAQTDKTTTKYPFDPRMAEQLMADAGFRKGPDGVYASADGAFGSEIKTNASAQFETEMHIIADGWRKVGFPFGEAVTPTALVSDGETRATFPGVYTFGSGAADSALRGYSIASIPKPENRWAGSNRGAWVNPEYDRLITSYDTTLDQGQRAQLAAGMMKIFSDEVPSIPIDFDPDVIAFVAGLVGPRPGAFTTETAWNIHEWTLR